MKDRYRREKKHHIKNIGSYISTLFGILAYNLKPALLFLLIYSATNIYIVTVVIRTLTRIAMEMYGTTYIGPDNLLGILLGKGTIPCIIIAAVVMVLLALYEIGGFIHAYNMSLCKSKTTLGGMICAGICTCKRALHPRNWGLIPFLLVLVPLAEVITFSGASVVLSVPEFINDFLVADEVYGGIYLAVLVVLQLVEMRFIFALNYFSTEDISFNEACKKSWRLTKKKHIKTVCYLWISTVIFSAVITGIAAAISDIISSLTVSMVDKVGEISQNYTLMGIISVFRQFILSVFAPAFNLAALGALFHKFATEKQVLDQEVFEKQTKANEHISKPFIITYVAVIAAFGIADVFIHIFGINTFSMQMSRPGVVAHRGDSVNAPENTMPAFELAMAENPDFIEFDVHMTKDGVIIVSHDDDLSRVSGQKLYVHELTYEQTQQLDVGSWFDDEFANLRLSTLDETLKYLKNYEDVTIQIEIKPSGYDDMLEERVLQVINDNGLHDRCMITCLKIEPLRRIKELDPDMTTVYSMFVARENLQDIEGADYVTVEASNVNQVMVAKLHAADKKLFAWTLNTEQGVQHLVDCGVDGILTDDPIMMKKALDGAQYSGGLYRAMRLYADRMISGY